MPPLLSGLGTYWVQTYSPLKVVWCKACRLGEPQLSSHHTTVEELVVNWIPVIPPALLPESLTYTMVSGMVFQGRQDLVCWFIPTYNVWEKFLQALGTFWKGRKQKVHALALGTNQIPTLCCDLVLYSIMPGLISICTVIFSLMLTSTPNCH